MVERPATIEDWQRIPAEKGAELIDGRIVYQANPGLEHGYTKAQLASLLDPYDRRRTGSRPGATELGGWWISLSVDMVIGEMGCRPDVVGWRRDTRARVPQTDSRGVVVETPDFLCEVLSASTARLDKGAKLEAYFRAGVPHYWLVDPDLKTLTVLERTDRGYLILRVAGLGETVRAAPFEGVEIPVDELFIDEEGELAAPEPEKAVTAEAGKAVSRVRGRAGKDSGATVKKRAPKRPG